MVINYSIWNYEAAGEDWRVADVLVGNGGPVLVWPDGRRQFFASLGAVLSFVRSGWPCAYLMRENPTGQKDGKGWPKSDRL